MGNTGLNVSSIGLGTAQFGWNVNKEMARKILDKAYDLGINFIDTADSYPYWATGSQAGDSEKIIGKWVQKNKLNGDFILATKVGDRLQSNEKRPELTNDYVESQLKKSLSNLNMDTIDLYQIHYPPVQISSDLLLLLNKFKDKNLIHSFGVCNISFQYLKAFASTAQEHNIEGFQTIQNEYSLISKSGLEQEFLSYLGYNKYGIITYSPLANGFLTGKYKRFGPLPDSVHNSDVFELYYKDHNFKAVTLLEELAEVYDASPAQLALSWILHQPYITTTLIGVKNTQQLEELVNASDIRIKKEDLDRLTNSIN